MSSPIVQTGSAASSPGFLASVCPDTKIAHWISPSKDGAGFVTPGRSLIDLESLHPRDFVLPQSVSKSDNGELSVRDCIDEAQRIQVIELASIVVVHRAFDSLPLAEQHLEERRYQDYLERKLKRGADPDELRLLQLSPVLARSHFRDWWAEKEERRRTAPLRKANRLANCRMTGRRLDCSVYPEEHQFFDPYNCGCRFCRYCGPRIFAELFNKYMALWRIVEKLVVHPGFRTTNFVGTIDFTARNLGRMPLPKELREFNQDVRACIKRVMAKMGISGREYLFLWCDEFGGWDSKKGKYNTNLHAHGVYVGPYLPYEVLLETWIELRKSKDGARGVFIKRQQLDHSPRELQACERARFARALGHALKYTGKHLSRADGERLAQLEAAFHGVRRMHAMGLAYNPDLTCHELCSVCGKACEHFCEHQGDHSCKRHRAGTDCPLCSGPLMFHRLSGYTPISVLRGEGRLDLDESRRQVARERVFAGPRGAPL